jgi:gliding motility-associated-like protein
VRILLLSLTLFLSICGYSQIKADFTASKQSGCSPLTVSFTNTSTGLSPSATFEWNFNNGNTSTLKDPSAIFTSEKTFRITLTVRDGALTSSKSLDIKVDPKPVIDFDVSVKKGCFPLNVQLTATATSQGSAITNYHWDFGDGYTESTTSTSVNHTFNYAQDPVINLTVTTANGCQQTLTKKDILKVLPKITADFNADKLYLCRISDAVNFTNLSTGPGTLSYDWDFGDNTTSNSKEPNHTFATKGTYSIKLTTTSSEGCIATIEKPALINVKNFKTDFTQENPLLCQNNSFQLFNASSPQPDETIWEYNNWKYYNSYNIYLGSDVAGPKPLMLINRFGTCYDTLVRNLDIKPSPGYNGFTSELLDSCGAPARIRLKDTSSGVVSWKWFPEYSYNYSSVTTNKNTYEYTLSYNAYIQPYVELTNAYGCSTTVYGKYINVRTPLIFITDSYFDSAYVTGKCGSITTRFSASAYNNEIVSYLWNFGDGTTSTESTPTKLFDKEGSYYVTLTYTLKNGCTGTERYDQQFTVEYKRKIDFKASETNVCGNTPVFFNTITAPDNKYHSYTWYFAKEGGEYQYFTGYGNADKKFEEEGKYSIKLVVFSSVCLDTVEKVNYLKVIPPFPKIQSFTPTCEGDRGLMTLTQTSKQTNAWTWDFGDGSPARTLSIAQDTIQHYYNKTGLYKVKLTNYNGACTVSDSMFVPVLMKQKPILSSTLTEVCQTGYFPISITNLEKNPWDNNYNYWGYSFYPMEYDDGTPFDGNISTYYNFDKPPFVNSFYNLNPTKKGIRIMTRSSYFECVDTTNIVFVKITGPTAKFSSKSDKVCEQDNVVIFKDESTSKDNPIVKWDWNFGDGRWASKTSGAPFTYQYNYSNQYWATLTVTDKIGCTSTIQNYDVVARKSSVEAFINATSTLVSPGTTVTFYNTSTTEEPANTEFKWIKSDGTIINAVSELNETYTTPGFYTVKIVVRNPSQGCSDTASVRIQVKYINAAFDMSKTNISSGKCVPVVVRFTNKSYNVSRINWDFGDGTTAENVFSPSHVYTKPGKYIITAKAYSDNNTEYITRDSVFIDVPQPSIASNILQACTAQDITLMGNRNDGMTYTWDPGDGRIITTSDSFYLHRYKMAGVYNPKLIQTDKNGCAIAVDMKESIIIDSLSIALKNIPAKICSPKDLFFDPAIYSVASDQANIPLNYHWNFGTGNAKDTANTRNPSFTYLSPGTYPITLHVSSPLGCSKSTSASIKVFEGLGGKITGPTEICEGGTAQFTASTIIAGNPVYKWILDDGSTTNAVQTPVRKYSAAGDYKIMLLVDNNGCVDSIPSTLTVRANPVINLSTRNAVLCEGSSLQVNAGGGSQYQWSPSTFIDNTTTPQVNINTKNNATYKVRVSNQFGCFNDDSVKIRVARPFDLAFQNTYTVCEGNEVKLQVNGAATYSWINNTSGLSNTNTNSPIAKPSVNTQYTVVGKDADNCFTDTARINMVILTLPTVNAGQDVELLTGAPYQLQSESSNDVTAWKWEPAKYLSCVDCPAPTITPLEPLNYILKVTSSNGCFGYDTVSVKLICSESRIYIPNAFTPDNNGRNDRFKIAGYGVKLVKYLKIYNRWGNLVFERTNFRLDDVNGSWDGTFNGKPVDTGTYVYVTEMSCNEQSFTKRGTVNVIR